MTVDGGRVRRALEGDSSLLVTRAVLLDDIHVRKDGTGRTVVAYAAVWNTPTEIVDSDGHYREQNHPESMTKSVSERRGRIFSVYNHGKTLAGTPSELHSVPLGKPTLIQPDSRGLLTHTLFNRDPEADRILEAVRSGSLTGMSYTGVFLRSEPELRPYERYGPGRDGALPLVTRMETGLIEYGVTPIPAYEDAMVLGVRSGRLLVDDEPAERETITLTDHAEPPAEAPSGDNGPVEPVAEPEPDAEPNAEHGRAAMDATSWDANAAMTACDTAADYQAVCAGRKDGPADQRSSWALPHHKSPGGPPNEDGVRAALSRLSQTEGLTNREAARRHLEAHMRAINPDYQTASSSGRQPAPETERAEPQTHPAPTRTRSRSMPDTDRAPLTVEERVARQSEIRARLAEIDSEYSGAELPQEARAEWQGLQNEIVEHERAIADASQRADYLRYINEVNPGATERVDNSRAGYAQPGGGGVPFQGGGSGAAFHPRQDIYDLAAIRNRARHIDEVPVLYREAAMRAVEQARFPGAKGAQISREDAQERVAGLLDTIDDEKGTLARRILVTGSPLYDRAFGKMLAQQSTHGLTAEESRALSLGTDAAGGYAVPFQLDPTVILTSNGAINPLRQIARVETITGKEWDGITSAGVTVSRVSEGTEAGTGDPAFGQPTVRTTRVQGFVPFSIELDVSWNALRGQITSLLMDAKDVEEGAGTSGFVLGNGTAPNAGGVVTTLGTASQITTAGTATLALADIYSLENAMPVRFRQQSAILASKTTYNKLTQLAQTVAALAGDVWPRLSLGTPRELNGYPAYEASVMSGSVTTSNALVLMQGDFSKFLIVDRVGMGIELIPHLFGSTNRYPTGQRGILAIWFNNSAILVPQAFRLLKIL